MGYFESGFGLFRFILEQEKFCVGNAILGFFFQKQNLEVFLFFKVKFFSFFIVNIFEQSKKLREQSYLRVYFLIGQIEYNNNVDLLFWFGYGGLWRGLRCLGSERVDRFQLEVGLYFIFCDSIVFLFLILVENFKKCVVYYFGLRIGIKRLVCLFFILFRVRFCSFVGVSWVCFQRVFLCFVVYDFEQY